MGYRCNTDAVSAPQNRDGSGLGIAAATDATIDSRFFWVFGTVATAAYMLSRGMAKAASRSRAHDPREDIDIGRD
jgi:hypothetical protein